MHPPMPPSAATQHTRMKANPSQSIVVQPQSSTVLGDGSSMGGWTSGMIEGRLKFLTKSVHVIKSDNSEVDDRIAVVIGKLGDIFIFSLKF